MDMVHDVQEEEVRVCLLCNRKGVVKGWNAVQVKTDHQII